MTKPNNNQIMSTYSKTRDLQEIARRINEKKDTPKALTTEIEFASPDGGFDTEVRIPETTLCWISGEDIDKFTEELQALITKYAI